MGAVVVKRNDLAIVDQLENFFHDILLPGGGSIPANGETDYSKSTGEKSTRKYLEGFSKIQRLGGHCGSLHASKS